MCAHLSHVVVEIIVGEDVGLRTALQHRSRVTDLRVVLPQRGVNRSRQVWQSREPWQMRTSLRRGGVYVR